MLRSLFIPNKDKDKAFIEMMHDFVDTHRDMPASTESFKLIAEKHMPHSLDLENNGRLDWFFREWVYGTEVPHYDFDYQTSPGPGGKTHIHLTITQSGVSDNFVMAVPIFADFGKGFVRLGQFRPSAMPQNPTISISPKRPRKWNSMPSKKSWNVSRACYLS